MCLNLAIGATCKTSPFGGRKYREVFAKLVLMDVDKRQICSYIDELNNENIIDRLISWKRASANQLSSVEEEGVEEL